MTALNIVRFRVKPGRAEHFVAAHSQAKPRFKGFRGGALVRTGEHTFCIVGEWTNFKSLAAARPQMIALLDSFRDDLEDLGDGLGVTDPVSGDVVLKLRVARAATKKGRTKTKRRKKRR